MPSNKDILNAQRFNRKRLVTAFIAGAPDGKELEPKSIAKPIVVGIVLGALVLGASFVFSFFSPALPNQWENGTLVVVKNSGTRYFSIEGTLRPLRNVSSAHLLAEPGALKETTMSADSLVNIPRGSEVGIESAPDSLPKKSELLKDHWSSCPAKDGKDRLSLGNTVPTASLDSALVTSNNETYLVSQDKRYRIPQEHLEQVKFTLAFESAPITDVDAAWLNLFAKGTDLTPIDIPQAGQLLEGMPPRLSMAVLGSILELPDKRHFIVTGPGQISPVTDMASRLYSIGSDIDRTKPIPVEFKDTSDLHLSGTKFGPADWPDAIGNFSPDDEVPCAELIYTKDIPSVQLVSMPTPDTGGVFVPGGKGVLVKTSGGGSAGTYMLISDVGRTFGIEGTASETLKQLGYSEEDALIVPTPWIHGIPNGPALSRELAWATVAKE